MVELEDTLASKAGAARRRGSNPLRGIMHKNSEKIFDEYVLKYVSDADSVLEIGPDKQCLFLEKARSSGYKNDWTMMDIVGRPALPEKVLKMEEYKIPAENNKYGIVLSAQVIEHVRKPWLWIKELTRVVKPDGYLILISPITWKHHRVPVDCWRIWPDGMHSLFEEADLIPIQVEICSLDDQTDKQIGNAKVTDLLSIGKKKC